MAKQDYDCEMLLVINFHVCETEAECFPGSKAHYAALHINPDKGLFMYYAWYFSIQLKYKPQPQQYISVFCVI